jgi:phosphorylcholine metabolism protein LicD
MSLADEVNTLLDQLSQQIKSADQTGVGEIKARLNKLTREGEIIKDIFTNDYYVNNMMLDKVIAEKS